MLGQITFDTAISSILSEDDISSYISSVEDAVIEYLSSVKSLIHQEESYGLSQKAFLVNQKALLSSRASQCISNLNLIHSYMAWRDELLSSLAVQRNKELQKLSLEISNKIQELSRHYDSLSYSYSASTDENYKSSLSSQMHSCKESIVRYQDKLKQVKGLM